MILVDIPMPENCINCPCSYWIISGDYQGNWMCNAMEFKAGRSGDYPKNISDFFVTLEDHRPENCPIRMEVIK